MSNFPLGHVNIKMIIHVCLEIKVDLLVQIECMHKGKLSPAKNQKR